MYYKNVIVGGGIAGLTLAHFFTKFGESYILLEKGETFGGRAVNVDFHGVNVTLGAGVIREGDKCVRDLVNDLKLTVSSWTSNMELHPAIHISETEKMEIIDKIKAAYKKSYKGTFREFINLNFPAEFILKFEQIVGHNDFWDADIKDVMEYYPVNELLVFPSTISAINGGWGALVKALIASCDPSNLRANEGVTEIDWATKTIVTKKNNYTCERVFLCGDASLKSIKLNLPEEISNTLSHISSVPFIRLYTFHPEKYKVPFLKVPTILQKLIPITDKVLMSAYTENYQAETLKAILERKGALITINKLIQNSIAGTDYTVSPGKDFVWKWWQHGIHYYTPHGSKLIKSQGGVFLLGEMASNNQGWVEGAVETVYKTICELWSEKCL